MSSNDGSFHERKSYGEKTHKSSDDEAQQGKAHDRGEALPIGKGGQPGSPKKSQREAGVGPSKENKK